MNTTLKTFKEFLVRLRSPACYEAGLTKIHGLGLIVFLASAALAMGQSHELWVKPGSVTDLSAAGTAADPIVVANATDFDSFMATNQPNAYFHLMAGTFHTHTYFSVRSGWSIVGDGMDQTVVVIDDLGSSPLSGYNDPNKYTAFCSGPAGHPVSGVRIADLTVDCNLQNQTAANSGLCMGAVTLDGNDLHVERVKAINFGSTANLEDFVIGIGYSDEQIIATNIIVDGCIITQPAANASNPDGLTCILICGIPSPLAANAHETDPNPVTSVGLGWIVGAEIKNCRVYGINNSVVQALQMNYVSDSKLHHNMVFNCPGSFAHGFYSENSCYNNLEISDNMFSGVGTAIYFNDLGYTNLRLRNNLSIHDNNVQGSSQGGISLSQIGGGALGYSNVNIRDNFISMSQANPGMSVYDCTNGIIDNNILNASGGNYQIAMGGDSNVAQKNNRNIDGSESVVNNYSLASSDGLTEFGFQFVPLTGGWYRLWQGDNYFSGKAIIEMNCPNSSAMSDVELDFYSWGNGVSYGSVSCVRNAGYAGGSIQMARVANDLWIGNSSPQYFDIYVPSGCVGNTIYVKMILDSMSVFPYNHSPQAPMAALTSTPAAQTVLNLTTQGGLQTSGPLIVNNQTVISANGQLVSAQLDSANLRTVANLSPASGALLLGNGSQWTATSLATSYGLTLIGSANATSALAILGLPSNPATVSTNQTYFIMFPDAYVSLISGGSVSNGYVLPAAQSAFAGWVCRSNAVASLIKQLPLPNEFWGGKSNLVTSWRVLTTNSGSFSFNIGNYYMAANGTSGLLQVTNVFTAVAGTNITLISATNTLPSASMNYVNSQLYLGNKTQPGNYSILGGSVSAQ